MPKVPQRFAVFLHDEEKNATAVLQRALQKFCEYYRRRKSAALVIQRAWLFQFRMNSTKRVVLRFTACKINLFTAAMVNFRFLTDQIQSEEFLKRFTKCFKRIYIILHRLHLIPEKHILFSFSIKVLVQAYLVAGQPKIFFQDALYLKKDYFVQTARNFLESFDFICERIAEESRRAPLESVILYSELCHSENLGSQLFWFNEAYIAWKENFVQFCVNRLKCVLREHYSMIQMLSPHEKLYKSERYESCMATVQKYKEELANITDQEIANRIDFEIQSDVLSRMNSPFLFYYSEQMDFNSTNDLIYQILLDPGFKYHWHSSEDWYTNSIFHILFDDLTVFETPNCFRILIFMDLIFKKMEAESAAALFAEQGREIWKTESIEETVKQDGVEVLSFFVGLFGQTLDLIRKTEIFQGKEYTKNLLSALDAEYNVQPKDSNRLKLYLCHCVQQLFVFMKHFKIDRANATLQSNVHVLLESGKEAVLAKFEYDVLHRGTRVVNFKTELYKTVDKITRENPGSFRTIFKNANFPEYCNFLVIVNLVMTGPSVLCKAKLPETLSGFYHNLHYLHEKIDFFVKVTSMTLRLQSSSIFYRVLKNGHSFEVCMQPVVKLCILAMDTSGKKNAVMTRAAFMNNFLEAVKLGFQLEPHDFEFIKFYLSKTFDDDDCVAKLQKTRILKMLTEYVLNASEVPDFSHVQIFQEQMQELFKMVKKIANLHMEVFHQRIHDTVLERTMVYNSS